MNIIIIGVLIASTIWFIKRAFFGPQRQLASCFLLCTLCGIAGVFFTTQGGIVFFAASILLLIAPLFALVSIIVTMWHDFKQIHANRKR